MVLRSIAIGFFWVLALVAGLWLGQVAAPEPMILVVPIRGTIQENMADQVENILTDALFDPTVVGIVLTIDSSGGTISPSERIYHAILQLRRAKPVVAYVTGSAQSGAYFVASATQYIYAPASSVIGSVGAYDERTFRDPLFPRGFYASGPYKLGSNRFDNIQGLDLQKSTFAESVYHRRLDAPNPLTMSIAELSEARSYLGREAVALGLIDAIGGRMDAIEIAAELAGVSNYQVRALEIPNLLSLLLSALRIQDNTSTLPAPSPTAKGE